MTVVVKHSIVTGAPSDPSAIVDGPAWDAAHVVTGLENVPNVDTTNASNITSGTLSNARLGANVVAAVTNDTNVTGSIASQNLTLGWTGSLALNRGGTGQTTAAAAFDALSPTTTRGDLIFRNATTNTRLAAGTAGYFLQANGSGADPSYAGFLQAGTGAVTRTWQDKGQDYINAADFGLLPSNTGAQNVTAWGVIMTFAASNPCTIKINRGTYDFNAAISFNAANTRITGDGIDATILRCTFASGDFITQSGTIYYQTIDNLTITSSVTRTAGAMFTSGFWKRGLMHRVKISRHFNGLNFPQFETCFLEEVSVVNPSGSGTGVIVGTQSASNQGAGLTLLNCFIRGNDETVVGATAVGMNGVAAYDIENLVIINSDIGSVIGDAVILSPQTRIAFCYFLNAYFDATVSGNNLHIGGTGSKLSMNFSACWFASAGVFNAGAANCSGLLIDNAGVYQDLLFNGCRFINSSGVGAVINTPYLSINITGCSFVGCGSNASSGLRNGILVSPASAANRTMNLTGNFFEANFGSDINITSNASEHVNLTGNVMNAGITWPDGTVFGNVSGNTDLSVTPSTHNVASASTIQVPPIYNYVIVSGTTNINRIQPTYPGHHLCIRFLAVLTVVDNGNNLRLVGNYTTTGNSVLTLVCEANGEWREICRSDT